MKFGLFKAFSGKLSDFSQKFEEGRCGGVLFPPPTGPRRHGMRTRNGRVYVIVKCKII